MGAIWCLVGWTEGAQEEVGEGFLHFSRSGREGGGTDEKGMRCVECA